MSIKEKFAQIGISIEEPEDKQQAKVLEAVFRNFVFMISIVVMYHVLKVIFWIGSWFLPVRLFIKSLNRVFPSPATLFMLWVLPFIWVAAFVMLKFGLAHLAGEAAGKVGENIGYLLLLACFSQTSHQIHGKYFKDKGLIECVGDIVMSLDGFKWYNSGFLYFTLPLWPLFIYGLRKRKRLRAELKTAEG